MRCSSLGPGSPDLFSKPSAGPVVPPTCAFTFDTTEVFIHGQAVPSAPFWEVLHLPLGGSQPHHGASAVLPRPKLAGRGGLGIKRPNNDSRLAPVWKQQQARI